MPYLGFLTLDDSQIKLYADKRGTADYLESIGVDMDSEETLETLNAILEPYGAVIQEDKSIMIESEAPKVTLQSALKSVITDICNNYRL